MMNGKIVFYDDNMDVFKILGEDFKTYYGFGNFKIGERVFFDFDAIYPGEYETLIAINIQKTDVKKLTLK